MGTIGHAMSAVKRWNALGSGGLSNPFSLANAPRPLLPHWRYCDGANAIAGDSQSHFRRMSQPGRSRRCASMEARPGCDV